MTRPSLATALAGAALLIAPASAFAQWMPGSEIAGQTLQVQTNGVTNTVYFGPGGQATITTPGGRAIPASWTATNGQLCLNNGLAQECWAYASAFQAGQPMTLASSCGTSTWLASAVNMPPPPPIPEPAGERG
jgi:hypothetical protein